MTIRSLVRRLIGVGLMVDGVMTAMWFSQLVDSLGGRDAVSVTAMVARVIVAALSVTAGWLITQHRPQGTPLGAAALLLMAGLTLFGAWTGALPSNLDPSLRRSAAVLLSTVAATAILFLRNDARQNHSHDSTGA